MDGQSEAWTTTAQQGGQYSQQIKLARDFIPNQTMLIDEPHCIVILVSLCFCVAKQGITMVCTLVYTNFASNL